jgi:small-conductance mechanosensitive channel
MDQTFWQEHGDEISAAITIAVAVAIAIGVDRLLIGRAVQGAIGLDTGELSREARTRLRLIRRLLFVAIILIGIALALSQFTSIKRFATGILASTAVLGIIIGFAGRQVIANLVSGILLAITQPIRIGDLVTFEEDTGTVEDVRLTYTYLRSDDGRRIIIPNERLAQNTIENHTIIDPRVRVAVSVWIPPDADSTRALRTLGGEDIDVQIAEIDKEGVRLEVGTWARTYQERGAVAAGLRAQCLETLRREGLSSKADA